MEEFVIKNYSSFDPVEFLEIACPKIPREFASTQFEETIDKLAADTTQSHLVASWCQRVKDYNYEIINTEETAAYWILRNETLTTLNTHLMGSDLKSQTATRAIAAESSSYWNINRINNMKRKNETITLKTFVTSCRTVKDVSKGYHNEYKIDCRIVVINEKNEVGLVDVESARYLYNQKVNDDHLKLCIESKDILDYIVAHFITFNPKKVFVFMLQICRNHCEIRYLRLCDNGLYCPESHDSLSLPFSPADFAKQSPSWFSALLSLKKNTINLPNVSMTATKERIMISIPTATQI